MFGRKVNLAEAFLATPPTEKSPFEPKPSDEKVKFLDHRYHEARRLVYQMLSYDDLAKLRQACRAFNRDASAVLIQGSRDFSRALERERCILKRELPRRESDRREHPLFSYSEIVSSLETRRDLLDMTYKRYIDKDMITFIPGKVLDEGWRLLRFLRSKKGTDTPFSYELLKDFRDLSSMAIDHFDEFIAPPLKRQTDAVFNNLVNPQLMLRTLSPSLGGRIPLFPDPKKAPTGALLQKVHEQDQLIKRQNEKIEMLNKTVALLISRVCQMGDYIGCPLPKEELQAMLQTAEIKSPTRGEGEQCCSTLSLAVEPQKQNEPQNRKRRSTSRTIEIAEKIVKRKW